MDNLLTKTILVVIGAVAWLYIMKVAAEKIILALEGYTLGATS